MAWNKLYREKRKGGIGKRMKYLSIALREKMALEEDRECIKVCKDKYLNNPSHFLRVTSPPYGYPFWNGMIKFRDWIGKKVTWETIITFGRITGLEINL